MPRIPGRRARACADLNLSPSGSRLGTRSRQPGFTKDHIDPWDANPTTPRDPPPLHPPALRRSLPPSKAEGSPAREHLAEVYLLRRPIPLKLEDDAAAAEEHDVGVLGDDGVDLAVSSEEAELRVRLVRGHHVLNAGYSFDHLRQTGCGVVLSWPLRSALQQADEDRLRSFGASGNVSRPEMRGVPKAIVWSAAGRFSTSCHAQKHPGERERRAT